MRKLIKGLIPSALIMSHSHDHAHGNMTGHNHGDKNTPEDELLVTKHTVSVESSSHSHNHSHEVKMLSIYNTSSSIAVIYVRMNGSH